MLLSHYLNDAYINKVIEIIDNIYTDDYYARMGAAWALATIAAKYPQKCQSYLISKNINMDKKTITKAKQKMMESYRVSEGFKDLIRNKEI